MKQFKDPNLADMLGRFVGCVVILILIVVLIALAMTC